MTSKIIRMWHNASSWHFGLNVILLFDRVFYANADRRLNYSVEQALNFFE